MKTILAALALATMLVGQAMSQESPGPVPGPDQRPPAATRMRGGPPPKGPDGQRPWWHDPGVRQKLQLSDEQRGKIESISRDHEIREIDLRADLEKQGLLLRRQMEADSPDESQVIAQVEKLSQARAQLEKSQMETVLAMRRVLTAEQAKKLRELSPGAAMPGPGFGPPGGGPPPPPEGPME